MWFCSDPLAKTLSSVPTDVKSVYKYPHAILQFKDAFYLYPISDITLSSIGEIKSTSDLKSVWTDDTKRVELKLQEEGKISGYIQNVTHDLEFIYKDFFIEVLDMLDLSTDLRKVIVGFL